MEWLLVKCFLWGLLVLVQIHGSKSCFEDERLGLLELKAFLLSNLKEKVGHMLLPSWVDDTNSKCCNWERVTCNSTTEHVTELALYHSEESSSLEYSGLLNISLFLPFKELMNLDLSGNQFNCCVENEGFERLSSLKRLEVLNLAYNSNLFGNHNILQFLGALTSLRNLNLSNSELEGLFPAPEISSLRNLEALDLSGNHFNGSLPMQELDNLKNLEVLILGSNEFNDTLPIQELLTFKKLRVLDLRDNYFMGNFPPSIGVLSALKVLSLSANKLNGTLPIQGFCELQSLEELYLSYNSFEGSIPSCLENMRSLEHLDLSFNQFTGNVPSSGISKLTSLEFIDLSHNRFDGVFPFNTFSNHSKLKVVELTSDSSNLVVETEYSDWVPMFQLELLALSNCNLNGRKGVFPKFLLSQYELRALEISHNNLKGTFPHSVLENNTRLQYTDLRNNSFTGQFHLSSSLPSLTYLDLSGNQFDGQLQENLGNIFPRLEYMNLSGNAFEGNIWSSVCDMSDLLQLDLSFNNFSGEVPNNLVGGCINLAVLRLSSNRFQGHILSSRFNLTSLMILKLDNNQFRGIVSNTIRFSQLVVLDISTNCISGKLPSWYSEIKHIKLQGNRITGSIPKGSLNSSTLTTLDVRDNRLSGSIPDSIGLCSNIRILLLSGNHLGGSIPNALCQLKNMSLMDLSNNFFSREIPRCFGNMLFGKIEANEESSLDTYKWNYEATNSQYLGHAFERYHTWYPLRTKRTFTSYARYFSFFEYIEQVEVKFVTKRRLSSYRGDILQYMSGLDLSCNNLAGEIPHELGNFIRIHALNLSHNQFKGSIPKSFSGLSQLESLDLSHNSLSGEIPPELIDLNFLAVFIVAHNNFSGRIPDMKAQFGTFDKSSYEGNPFLCGPPLNNNCTRIVESPKLPAANSDEDEGKWYEVDPMAFWSSFGASFVVILLGFATILYVNPYWRRTWFYFIGEFTCTCYYFIFNCFYELSSYLSK